MLEIILLLLFIFGLALVALFGAKKETNTFSVFGKEFGCSGCQ